MTFLNATDISKRFGNVVAVDDLTIDVTEGDIVCLLGPSGCGKTTLLRLIAGLESADSGQVMFDGGDVTKIPVHKRGFGMMFQNFALFPHLNVFDNVAYGLKMQRWNSAEITQRVHDMLSLVEMSGYETRSIDALSGGQQQRVALARALATRPKLLMLDEPLGALDRALRERLMLDLRSIIKRVGVTAIYVTHDQSEAYAIADKVAIMQNGRLEQYATPQAIFQQPATQFVAQFIGFDNLVKGRTLSNELVETAVGVLRVSKSHISLRENEDVIVLIRPNALSLSETPNQLTATHIRSIFRGRYSELTFDSNDTPLTFETDTPTHWSDKHTQSIYLDPTAIQILPRS